MLTLDKNNYKNFDLSKFDFSFWQSGIWINIILSGNQAKTVFILEKNDKYIIAEIRKISFGFGLFVLGVSDENIDLFKNDLIILSKQEKCLFVQFETINYEGYKNKENFQNKYYKKFITPYTALIDLTKSEEEILSLMKPKGRYNIKVAEKNEIIVKKAEITDENIKIFYDLMLETTTRDSFNGNNLDFYKNFLTSSNSNLLLIAYKGEIPVRAGIFVYFGNIAIYYYGASSSDKNYRNLMAPYLLQWTAIKEGKFKGCALYDFLGIADPKDKNSSLSGVTDFKLKLTPDTREVSKSKIYINNIFLYKIIILLKKLKNGKI